MKGDCAGLISSRFLLGREPKGARDKKHSSGLTGAIIGIGISLVPIVLVLIVSNGMIQGITDRYMETKTYHIQVAVPSNLDSSSGAEGKKALLDVPSVRNVVLETDGTGIIASPTTTKAVLIRAIEDSYFTDPGTGEYLKVLAGEPTPKGTREIVLGEALANELHVGIGDSVTIITPSAASASALKNSDAQGQERFGSLKSDFGLYSPKLTILKIKGIVSAGYRNLDASWAFVSPEAGSRILAPEFSISYFGIKTNNAYSNSLGNTRLAVEKALEPLYPNWFESRLVRTWPEIEVNLYKSFGTTKSVLMLIMILALIVAAVNLGSALSTFVAEHRKDIAVLRSTGAEDSLIRGIFLRAGLITGGLGTIAGLCAGLIVAINVNALIMGLEWVINFFTRLWAAISGTAFVSLRLLDPSYYLERIPIVINFADIAILGVLSVVLCVLCSLVPARKAIRVSVQELIRKN